MITLEVSQYKKPKKKRILIFLQKNLTLTHENNKLHKGVRDARLF